MFCVCNNARPDPQFPEYLGFNFLGLQIAAKSINSTFLREKQLKHHRFFARKSLSPQLPANR